MQELIYLQTGKTDPYYNLAFEEYVLTHLRTGNYLILWQNDNTIVIGRNQNTEAEINASYVREHGIRVVRRTTGGGAVYHDLGNLNYSFITDVNEADKIAKERFSVPIIEALRGLGIEASLSGRNDILAGGKKISGTAQRIDRDRILHHGTLLFDSDPSKIEGALHVDPEKLTAKGIRSVRSRVGNLRPMLPSDMTLDEFRTFLLHALCGEIVTGTTLPEEALQEISSLRDTKYASWEWNYGLSPAASFHKKRRFEGGSLEICADLHHDRMKTISFYGDFLAVRDLQPLEAALRDTPFRIEDIRDVLSRYPLAEYFGGITEEDILSLLFT